MKKPSLFLLTFFFITLLYAQSASVTLDTICASLSAHPNTTGDFTQTKTIKTNNRKLKSSGQYIICGQGILWSTEKPVASKLILTKDTMVQIAANGSKSVMNGKDNQIFSNISETLSCVFSGDAAALKKNFTCDFSSQPAGTSNATSASSGAWTLHLTPKDSTIASVMTSLELSGTYSQNQAEMTKLVMTEASENSIIYEFTNQKYPKELSADEKQNFVLE